MRYTLTGFLAVICLAFGLTPATAIEVPATAQWVDTGIDVSAGDVLEIGASGTWRDGSVTSGPEGSGIQWPDNFLNLRDLGVCHTCATERTPGWGALIGYIGNSPPAPGSYISTDVLPEALKIFYI